MESLMEGGKREYSSRLSVSDYIELLFSYLYFEIII